VWFVLMLTLCPWVACRSAGDGPPADRGSMEQYARLAMPTRIEIQRFLTKPVSFAGSGNADGLEVILAAYDSAGDLTKLLGTFHFELQTRRLSDRIGTRVAFWPVEIGSEETLRQYRDHLTRFYCFPLQLDSPPLRPGRYVLSAWLHLPDGQRLFDEYEFSYDGAPAAPPPGRS
jgi:hypothetical protein